MEIPILQMTYIISQDELARIKFLNWQQFVLILWQFSLSFFFAHNRNEFKSIHREIKLFYFTIYILLYVFAHSQYNVNLHIQMRRIMYIRSLKWNARVSTITQFIFSIIAHVLLCFLSSNVIHKSYWDAKLLARNLLILLVYLKLKTYCIVLRSSTRAA